MDTALILAIAGAAFALAILTSGNADPDVPVGGSWAWPEIATTLVGAAACAVAIAVGGRGRRWGLASVGLFGLFTAFAALSILWSVQPDWSWYGTDQLLAYLSAFAGAVALARVFPARWTALVGAMAVGMTALAGYSLLAKVFPATLAAASTYGRLQAPFGYWNAIGLAAAMGVPACLWAAARREGGPLTRAAAAPAMTVLFSVIVLSYSRSAALAAVIGGGVFIVFVPLRLRSALMAAVGGLGAVPIVIWALGNHALTTDHTALPAQDSAGHSFGIVLVIVLVVVSAAGLVAALAMDRVALPETLRRRVGTALIVLVALVPIAAIGGLAASQRGLTGEISHAWQTLTTSKGTGDTSARLTQLGSSRPMYWHQGLDVGAHNLLAGAGELGYGIARLRYTPPSQPWKTDQAHSFVIQTFADLGLIGVALMVALLVAWGRDTLRTVAPGVGWGELDASAERERQGLIALAGIVLAFGIQSTLDWTWYFPGVAIPALACAGWLAGRGPLTAPVRRLARRAKLIDRPGTAALITGVVAAALIAAWLMWEPLHSTDEYFAATNATTNTAAFSDAHAAAGSNPLSDQPLELLALLYQSAHDNPAARAELVKATRLLPDDPEPWAALGTFDQQTRARRAAVADMNHVLALDHTADEWTKAADATIAAAGASSGG
ncbi:MAG TPA: O-antigen ligase family protein [Solirubrobacteraceae bacterium]|nr:O-antigen ligase family protein [Solirubrobacteraceae bacterium]